MHCILADDLISSFNRMVGLSKLQSALILTVPMICACANAYAAGVVALKRHCLHAV